jgi:2',3'-cyclic-nucleotide 2'-phosphodiesterase (5'-nucleotidase family)
MNKSILFGILVFSLLSCSENKKEKKKSDTSNQIEIKEASIKLAPNLPEDSILNNQLEQYRQRLKKDMGVVLTYSNFGMVKERPQSRLTNLMADMVLSEGRMTFSQPIDFCLLNYGGIRSSLPKGDITLKNVYELMPFDNAISILTIPGDSIVSMVNYLKRRGGEPVSGLELIFEDEKEDIIKINGNLLKKDKNYTLITSDYLANGGDRMKFLSNPLEREDNDLKIRDLIINYFKKNPKLNSTTQSRITYVKK